MAIKYYGYYLKGNRVAIAQRDTDDTSSSEYGMYKSPTESVTEGLEIEYTYAPFYRQYSNPMVNINKFHILGWTVVGGYLSFVAMLSVHVPLNWTAATENNVTAGSQGDTGGQSLDYILVKGSERWNGLHRIKTANANGVLTTYTKATSVPYGENHALDFSGTNKAIYDASGSDPVYRFGSDFSAGEYIFITGSNEAVNNGLFVIDEARPTATAATDWIVLGNKYYHAVGSSADPPPEFSESVNGTGFTMEDETDQTDISFYKIMFDPTTVICSDIDVLNDENDEIDLTRYQSSAIVYYLKAKMAEDTGDLKMREFFMREFKRQLEKERSGRKRGPYIAMGNANMRKM